MAPRIEFSFYITLTDPYIRFILVINNKVWDDTNSVLAWETTWTDTAIDLSEDAVAGNVPVVIPTDLPAGEYDVLLYDAASPATGDAESLGKRLRWNGTKLLGLPIDL